MFKVLILEDSDEYQKILARTLTGYQLAFASNAEEGIRLTKNQNFDVILLDINLPGRDGYSVLSELQSDSTTSSIPVLCLTGRKETSDKITAFSLGADDYITKPFDPLELRARVEMKLKKNSRKISDTQTTVVGDIEIDHARHRVTVISEKARHEIVVTQTEFKLLCCFARRPEQVFSRDQLLVAAWGEDAQVLDRVVDVHICMLRKKLTSESYSIKAVTGVGYKLAPISSKKKAS